MGCAEQLMEMEVAGLTGADYGERSAERFRPPQWLSVARLGETFRTDFPCKPRRRGLRGVKLVISDAHEGIKAAV
jgi:hypothetical protein